MNARKQYNLRSLSRPLAKQPNNFQEIDGTSTVYQKQTQTKNPPTCAPWASRAATHTHTQRTRPVFAGTVVRSQRKRREKRYYIFLFLSQPKNSHLSPLHTFYGAGRVYQTTTYRTDQPIRASTINAATSNTIAALSHGQPKIWWILSMFVACNGDVRFNLNIGIDDHIR